MSKWQVVTDEFEGCCGNGVIECLCAGDFCTCSNQGEVRCIGCPDCLGYTEEDGEDYDSRTPTCRSCALSGVNADEYNGMCKSCYGQRNKDWG